MPHGDTGKTQADVRPRAVERERRATGIVTVHAQGNEARQTGDFRILEKDKDHRSSLFGNYLDANGGVIQKDVDTSKHPMPAGAHYEGADMPNWMRIVSGTGMHAGFLPGVVERDRNQTEFTRTTEDYLSIAASDERVSLGRQMQGLSRRALAAAA